MIKRGISISALAVGILAWQRLGEAQAVTTNQQGYWPMDTITSGSTPDASGKNHPASQATAAKQPTATAGLFNGALSFDGTADYLSVADHADLNVGTGNFTVAAWVKPASTNTQDRLINKWNGSVGWVCDINTAPGGSGVSAGFVRMRLSTTAATVDPAFDAHLTAGAWTHLAVTVDRGANLIRFYANGTQIGQNAAVAGDLSNAAALGIGSIPSADAHWLNSALDEVRFYNAALTQPQVLTLVQPLPPTGLTANPVTGYNIRNMDLSWTASAGSLSYQVLRSETSGSGYVVIGTGITGTTFHDTDTLDYDKPYYYVVRGFNTVAGPNSTQAMGLIAKPIPRTEKAGSGKDHLCNMSTAGAPGPAGFIAGLLGLALILAALRKAS